MPDHNLEQLLNELFSIDPSLRAHEADVRRVVLQLLNTQPTFSLSPSTITKIQNAMMEQTPTQKTPGRRLHWPSILAVPAMAAAVILGVIYYPESKTNTPTVTQNNLRISTAAANSFGLFSAESHVSRQTATSANDTKSSGAPTTSTSDSAVTSIAPYRQATFTYDQSFTIPQLPVLQRTAGFAASTALAAGGLMSLGSIDGLKIDSISASQQTTDGYTVTIDYRGGSISMYKNSGTVGIMKDAVLGTREGISSIPPDAQTVKKSTVIDAANAFAQRHGIDRTGYDAPMIQTWVGQTTTGDTVSAPATVIYPLSINGQPVYDESGNRYGMQMTVDQDGQVISLYNLTTLRFTSSRYDVATSTKAITDYLGRGGWMWASKPTGETTAYATLTPSTGYIMSRYQLDQTATEYLVPALIFGLSAKDQAATGRLNVVVPVLDALLAEPSTSKLINPMIDLPANSGSGSTTPTSGATEPAAL